MVDSVDGGCRDAFINAGLNGRKSPFNSVESVNVFEVNPTRLNQHEAGALALAQRKAWLRNDLRANVGSIETLEVVLDHSGNLARHHRTWRSSVGDKTNALPRPKVVEFIVRKEVANAIATNDVNEQARIRM